MTLKEITPEDSLCPVFIDPIDASQIEADQADRDALKAEKETRSNAKAALLKRLGMTADEAALLLG